MTALSGTEGHEVGRQVDALGPNQYFLERWLTAETPNKQEMYPATSLCVSALVVRGYFDFLQLAKL